MSFPNPSVPQFADASHAFILVGRMGLERGKRTYSFFSVSLSAVPAGAGAASILHSARLASQ
jgi:hypothetical protein